MPSRLHPSLQTLLQEVGWERLTGPQDAAMEPLLGGEHLLLVAPTGHGKTEAALLPVLSRLLAARDGGDWPKGFKVLYVTPLRALNRDLIGRLESWGIRLGIEIGVRHGDTSAGERARQARRPPDVLITTPETVQLLLYGDTLRRHLRTLRFVVVDEVHDLAISERGSQLMVALERIEEVISQPSHLVQAKATDRPCPDTPSAPTGGTLQRIGLSATVADPAAVATFLAGRDRFVRQVVVDVGKEFELAAALPSAVAPDDPRTATLSLPPAVLAELLTVRQLVSRHERVLVFQNTRDGAEMMVSRSGILDDDEPLLVLHHGSLASDHRIEAEAAFKEGRVRGLVATSSMELGIDVGAIDHVVQVHSPRSVARLVQRMGRAGHRAGEVSHGTLLAAGPEDLLECMAVVRMATAGRLEPLTMRREPLSVLANQIIALSNEYQELSPAWVYGVITRSWPFMDLDEGIFDAVWHALLDFHTLYEGDRAGHIGRSGRGRRTFLERVSVIQDERSYRVMDETTKRSIGTVDDAFVAAAMHPGALIIMAGRSWRVLEVEVEAERVRVAPAKEIGSVPQWAGAQLPVSHALAREVMRLRRAIVQGDQVTLAETHANAKDIENAAAAIRRHGEAGLVVPTDATVTVEVAKRVIVANVALGSRGNETLGRLMQALLHQRLGAAVGMQYDAYRIHLEMPTEIAGDDILQLWADLEPDHLDLLLAMVLRGTPVLRHHLVHVGKQFGALPKALDPNRLTRARLDALFAHEALSEEATGRLIHDRLDVEAVQGFLQAVAAGEVQVVVQGMGPLSRMAQAEARGQVAPQRSDDALLDAVRSRIERADVLMACTNCGHNWSDVVKDLPRRIHCRRCRSVQVACLRPWHEDQLPWLKGDPERLRPQEKAERHRIIKNGAIVASFGDVAARALVARGVGPDTAARILQKVMDPDEPAFWRELLQAELTFARTNAFWKR